MSDKEPDSFGGFGGLVALSLCVLLLTLADYVYRLTHLLK